MSSIPSIMAGGRRSEDKQASELVHVPLRVPDYYDYTQARMTPASLVQKEGSPPRGTRVVLLTSLLRYI